MDDERKMPKRIFQVTPERKRKGGVHWWREVAKNGREFARVVKYMLQALHELYIAQGWIWSRTQSERNRHRSNH